MESLFAILQRPNLHEFCHIISESWSLNNPSLQSSNEDTDARKEKSAI